MDNHDNKNTCTACSCPCEMHKEHNHLVEEETNKDEKSESVKACTTCGQEHKQDGTPAFSCK